MTVVSADLCVLSLLYSLVMVAHSTSNTDSIHSCLAGTTKINSSLTIQDNLFVIDFMFLKIAVQGAVFVLTKGIHSLIIAAAFLKFSFLIAKIVTAQGISMFSL